MKDIGLVALLVLTLGLVAAALRTPTPPNGPTAKASRSDAAATASSSAASASPTTSVLPGQGAIAVFLGDSFAAGVGASTPERRFTTLLSQRFGWKEQDLAHPGTGYLKSGGPAVCNGSPCQGFAALIPSVEKLKPALVIITGGANDLGQPEAEVRAAVNRTFTQLTTDLPQTKVIVVNPWWGGQAVPERLGAAADVIQSAAGSHDITYIDIGQPLSESDGLLTGGEANDRGHAAIAQAIGDRLEGLR
ncbi:SGNH/GDSL hydrolase family protein [Actinomycetota bacterium]